MIIFQTEPAPYILVIAVSAPRPRVHPDKSEKFHSTRRRTIVEKQSKLDSVSLS